MDQERPSWTGWRANRVMLRDLQLGLRNLVNEWDPIGVAEFAPDDEYDCLVAPLLGRLNSEAGPEAISEYLQRELADHFGTSLDRSEVEGFARRAVAWWASARPTA